MKLYVVGFGCGSHKGMTLEAEAAVSESDLIVGYTVYAELLRQHFPDKEYYTTGMRQEKERVKMALAEAAKGKTVALVCSGDSAVYGMAGLAYELSAEYPDVEIQPVAGVTASLSGGAVLGAPLTHDFAVISLSDLLTPWEKIELRLRCAAEADFTIALYNPASRKRTDHLKRACRIMLCYKSPETVCGYVKNIGRAGQESHILTLGELQDVQTDMFTTVFIGNSETKEICGKMVTPRGYRNV
ncbi:MAG: precorrin-3B C(17)-methyltransferase [Ruminococcus sp.]|nr:precorrin-3B C(17)-methyltransferase [Ruminococcus sp.]